MKITMWLKEFFYWAIFYSGAVWLLRFLVRQLLGNGIRILTAHRVFPGEWEKEEMQYLTEAEFERMVKHLARHYRVISLEQALELLVSPGPMPAYSVVLTFDDGYEENYSRFFPLIHKYKVPATFFLCTGLMDKPKRLSWSEAREMMALPLVSFGSHSVSHPILSRLGLEDLHYEIFASKQELQERLGLKEMAFCYPNGIYSDEVMKMVREAGYLGACSTRRGINFKGENLFALKRVPLGREPFYLFGLRMAGLYEFNQFIKSKFGLGRKEKFLSSRT